MMQFGERSDRTGHATGPCTSHGTDHAGTFHRIGGQDHEASGMGLSGHGKAFAPVPPARGESSGRRSRIVLSAFPDEAR